jgi:phenylacetate-CoA ligase
LPPFARSLTASAHGSRLRRWRYGPETDELVRQARERESWNADQWKAWIDPRLRQILVRAREQVPAYRTERQGRSDGISPQSESLQDWPVLTKSRVRENPEAFVAADAPVKQLKVEHTSGTTGSPLKLWHGRDTARSWYALMEARWRGWYGVSRNDRWAILGGQLVAPVGQARPPYWVWNSGLNQLYLSSYHLSPGTCSDYLSALQEYAVEYLWGYASSLHSLALFAAEQHLTPAPLKVVISNAEPLLDHQRKVIGQVFGCPVRDTYGMCEMVGAASECEAGRLHLWPEAGIYEVLQDDRDQAVKPGEVGRLVCTGLLNTDMPLIRYEVGDRVAVGPPGEKCSCGRSLPVLLSVEGRCDDVILAPDGRRVGRLDPVFKGELPIREAQIIQESVDLIRVLVVAARGFNESHRTALVAALRERIGRVTVEINEVDTIPRGAGGKFRAVISRLGRNLA